MTKLNIILLFLTLNQVRINGEPLLLSRILNSIGDMGDGLEKLKNGVAHFSGELVNTGRTFKNGFIKLKDSFMSDLLDPSSRLIDSVRENIFSQEIKTPLEKREKRPSITSKFRQFLQLPTSSNQEQNHFESPTVSPVHQELQLRQLHLKEERPGSNFSDMIQRIMNIDFIGPLRALIETLGSNMFDFGNRPVVRKPMVKVIANSSVPASISPQNKTSNATSKIIQKPVEILKLEKSSSSKTTTSPTLANSL